MEYHRIRFGKLGDHSTVDFALQELTRYLKQMDPQLMVEVLQTKALDPGLSGIIWVGLDETLEDKVLPVAEKELDDAIRISNSQRLYATTVKTRPYPGFPTDMQAQICVCMTLADGVSRLTESVYETRFFGYCTELESMGAKIEINGKTATINGREKLKGNTVVARDLRAGAALVIAGLVAEGTTRVENIHYIERGYENLVEKLTALGANIRRIED